MKKPLILSAILLLAPVTVLAEDPQPFSDFGQFEKPYSLAGSEFEAFSDFTGHVTLNPAENPKPSQVTGPREEKISRAQSLIAILKTATAK